MFKFVLSLSGKLQMRNMWKPQSPRTNADENTTNNPPNLTQIPNITAKVQFPMLTIETIHTSSHNPLILTC